MESLWPDNIVEIKERTPVSILREQASLLGEKTNNVVIAEVKPANINSGYGDDYEFGHSFFLIAPALGDYHYKAFTTYNKITSYPLIIGADEDIKTELESKNHELNLEIIKQNGNLRIDSEEMFLKALKAIFNSEKIQKVISSIIAQSVE